MWLISEDDKLYGTTSRKTNGKQDTREAIDTPDSLLCYKVAEKDTILIVCNRLSKITYFMVTIERMTVEDLKRMFRNNL